MKLVKEILYEKFTSDSDPIKDMNVGKKNQILNDLKKIGIKEEDIILNDDYSFFIKMKDHEPSAFFTVQMKYFPPEKAKLIDRIKNTDDDIKDIIDEAIKNGISIKDIKYIVTYMLTNLDYNNRRWNTSKRDLTQAEIYLTKLSKTKKERKAEEENNIYVFIGYYDKVPVDVNGKKYFEKKFCVENMVKFDKYNVGQLLSIEAMKHRVMAQYGKGNDYEAEVYMLTIPKFIMDEDNYYNIPEEHRYLIEKYKVKI
jgi:hypothetical protein